MTTEPPALAGPPRSPPDAPVALDMRVLVVDDNVDAADSLGDLLRLLGADVHVCHDGAAAVRDADAFHPDAALLDINMPGMDGCEVARRLHAAAPESPVLLVAVTAVSDAPGQQATADSGFDLHLTKPADPARLVAALSEHRAWLRSVGVKE